MRNKTINLPHAKKISELCPNLKNYLERNVGITYWIIFLAIHDLNEISQNVNLMKMTVHFVIKHYILESESNIL